MSGNYSADPYQRGSVLSRSFLPLALITLGVVFLLGNLVPERGRGGLVILGLGVAFLLGRVTTGRYGYAVPAGILLAIGTYVGLQEFQTFQPNRGGGLFFVCLGLGFALVYMIGSHPAAVWPLFPATVLIGLGLLLFGVVSASFTTLASLSWIVTYWPAVLVLVGVWLLFREQLPEAMRRPIATLGGLALLGYGVLAAAASIAGAGAGLMANFGPGSLTSNAITLDAPIATGQTFTVNNSSGRTTIHGSPSATTAHVVATPRFGMSGQAPDVRLTPTSSGLNLEASGASGHWPFGASNRVEYTVELPAAVMVTARTGDGQVQIDGITGEVQAETSSGQLKLTDLGGAVQAHSSSGSIELSNIAGEVRATTSSGQVRGTGLQHVREASSSSGYLALEGIFTDPAQIHTSSGSVNLKLLPGSAVHLDAKTNSGAIQPQSDLHLTNNPVAQRTKLLGDYGSPVSGATLAIETSSGTVIISQ